MSTPIEPNFEQSEFPLRSGGAALAREENLRHVRRVSNWSLAALLVGVGRHERSTCPRLAWPNQSHRIRELDADWRARPSPIRERSGTQRLWASGRLERVTGRAGHHCRHLGTGTITQGGVVSTGFTGKDS